MAERFNEADVYAVLGMEAPAEQPEAADRASQSGEKEPAITEPAGAEERAEIDSRSAETRIETEPGSNHQKTDTDGPASAPQSETPAMKSSTGHRPVESPKGEADSQNSGEMPKEERARQAQMRRERETQARIDAALRTEREKHAAELKKVFEKAGMTDRYNDNRPITTMEEFDAWDKAGQAAGLSRRLQEGKLTPEDFQRAIDNSPAVQEAREISERLKAREMESRQQEYQQLVEQELAEIRKLDPGVNTLQDILDRDTGPEFSKLVQEHNLSFVQAFRLANADRLTKAQTMAAEEGRARAQHGKDHMRTSVSGGGAVLDVPRETVELFRQMNPGMTMEEIRKAYNRWTPKKK